MTFLNICPRDDEYLKYHIKGVDLKVIADTGVDTKPDLDIKVNTLNKGNRQFINNSGDGNTFKIDVLIEKNDTIQGSYSEKNPIVYSVIGGIGAYRGGGTNIYHRDFRVLDLLDYWMRSMMPLFVTTDALDIPNDLYVITANNSRKQTLYESTVWSLEFTKYSEVVRSVFTTDNTRVKKAIATYNKKKKAAAKKGQQNKKTTTTKKTNIKQSNSLQNKFKKCNYKKVVYSKKKKTITCVKYLQKILNKKLGTKLKVDGWYGSLTSNAVKKFQKKYKKKYKLKVTGKVDSKTFKALYSV